MIKDQPQFRIRLPEELKEEIEARARDAGRSLNAEIVIRLEQSLTLDANKRIETIESSLGEIRTAMIELMKANLSESDLKRAVKALRGEAGKGPHFFPKTKSGDDAE